MEKEDAENPDSSAILAALFLTTAFGVLAILAAAVFLFMAGFERRLLHKR